MQERWVLLKLLYKEGDFKSSSTPSSFMFLFNFESVFIQAEPFRMFNVNHLMQDLVFILRCRHETSGQSYHKMCICHISLSVESLLCVNVPELEPKSNSQHKLHNYTHATILDKLRKS
ncbi:hypothetical protein AMECASPLE_001417 [Ameca splendens]|uniref:Uncharacterized protein n=1 Tax=Ameca splendens TaxID=208324 RepID=A0ABV0YKE0_9TELE